MAPKAMKAMKVLNLHLKRPAAQGHPQGEGMSLEEKMEMFQKRNNMDVNSFLDGLTKQHREGLRQRFANARAALKDGEADAMWQDVAKGKALTQPRRSSWPQGAHDLHQVLWPLVCKSCF